MDSYALLLAATLNAGTVLALAAGGGEMNGTTIKNSVRSISQGAGSTKVDNAVDGLKLLASWATPSAADEASQASRSRRTCRRVWPECSRTERWVSR